MIGIRLRFQPVVALMAAVVVARKEIKDDDAEPEEGAQ